MVYLFRQLGAENELKFGYNWYVHGPYSPDLTKVLFNPDHSSSKGENSQLSKSALQTINSARNFLGEDFYSVDSLELIVSLIYLIRNGPSGQLKSKQDIAAFLRDKKPQFNPAQVEAAWKKIKASGLWNDYLARISD
jgi:hypothetical protein